MHPSMRSESFRRQRRVTVAALLAGAGLLACRGSDAASRRPPGGPAAVAVTEVTRTTLSRRVTLTGPVEPIRTVGVNSRAAGTILSVRVVEGDRVRTGQRMAELDAGETTAQLGRARAILANATTAFHRSEQMHERQIITDAEYEQARSAFEAAKSDVELWEARLEFARILAPTNGVVTAKLIEAGSAVNPNQRLFDIAVDSLLVIKVQMSELDVVNVAAQDAVGIQVDAYPGVPFRGQVRRIFPSADPTTRLVPVEVALRRAPGGAEIRPGFLARVQFDLERRERVLTVPAAALGTASTGPYVYLVQADTLVRQPVVTGLTSGGLVEVASGLQGGELVVTSGQVNLRAGGKVRITQRVPMVADSSVAAGIE